MNTYQKSSNNPYYFSGTSISDNFGITSLIGDREEQQDCSLFVPNEYAIFLLVADGLGGHKGGKHASECIVNIAKNLFIKSPLSPAKELFTGIVEQAYDKICALPSVNKQMPGTTVAMIRLRSDGVAEFAHVGDTRIYIFSPTGKIVHKTRDHSIAQLAIANGEMTEEEAQHHNDRNILYNSVGGGKHPKVTFGSDTIEDGSIIILCSDGFWEFFGPSSLALSIIKYDNIKVLTKEAAEAAVRNAKGDADNATVMVFRYERHLFLHQTGEQIDGNTTNLCNDDFFQPQLVHNIFSKINILKIFIFSFLVIAVLATSYYLRPYKSNNLQNTPSTSSNNKSDYEKYTKVIPKILQYTIDNTSEAEYIAWRMCVTIKKSSPNCTKSSTWITNSANDGYHDAQFELAKSHLNGEYGFRIDYEMALKYFKLAASQNDANAALIIGKIYEKGLVGPKDLSEALIWYTKACELGNKDAVGFRNQCKNALERKKSLDESDNLDNKEIPKKIMPQTKPITNKQTTTKNNKSNKNPRGKASGLRH
jgi:serine/threonine protein phosphatase PrpC